VQAGPGAAKPVPRLGVASVVIPGPERKPPCTEAVLSNHFNDALLATSAHLAISCLRNASSLSGEPPT
jgi:hypothetical protein